MHNGIKCSPRIFHSTAGNSTHKRGFRRRDKIRCLTCWQNKSLVVCVPYFEILDAEWKFSLMHWLLVLQFQQLILPPAVHGRIRVFSWISKLYLFFEGNNGPIPFVWFSFSVWDNSMFVYAVSCYFKKFTLIYLDSIFFKHLALYSQQCNSVMRSEKGLRK